MLCHNWIVLLIDRDELKTVGILSPNRPKSEGRVNPVSNE